MSKVFVGTVNGEKFNNEKDFQVAVAKAMFAGGDLNISSCYRYNGECGSDCDCKENQCQCNESKQNDAFVIPTSKLKPNQNFDIPECVNDFDKISLTNYSEISSFITKNIKSFENEYKTTNEKLKELKEQYAVVKSELEKVEKESETIYNSWSYYTTIKDILQKNKPKDENKSTKNEHINSDDLTFGDFITALGFLFS